MSLEPSTITMILAQEDVFDVGNRLLGNVESFVRAAVVVIAIIVIIWQAYKNGFTMARLATAIIVAGLLVWGVWNIDDASQWVDQTLNPQGAGVQTVVDAPAGTFGA